METAVKSRFDTRLPKEQKEFFEYAASLGGFRSLSEFFVHSAQQFADSIIEKHNSILASKKDQEVFFNAVMNPPKPNESLRRAATQYKEAVSGK